jgi:hypothetical protein
MQTLNESIEESKSRRQPLWSCASILKN